MWRISQLSTDHSNFSLLSTSIPEYFITSESYRYYAIWFSPPLLEECSEYDILPKSSLFLVETQEHSTFCHSSTFNYISTIIFSAATLIAAFSHY